MRKGKAKEDIATNIDTGIGAKKGTRTRSAIWDHFVKTGDGTKAKCNYCGKVLVSDSCKSGTSSLWKHIEACYAYKNLKFDDKQKTLRFDGGSGLKLSLFNKDECRRALIRMIILDEFPYSIVDGEGFKDFVKTLCPKFDVPSRRTIVRDVFYLYNETKESLKAKLVSNKQRISITTDTWTSIQNINYMVITAHFIDKNWKLHKRILNFSVISNHKGETIGQIIEDCLLDWGIEHVACITVDNAKSNDSGITYVKEKLMNWKHDSLILGGAHMHVRCSAHVVNLIVKQGLKDYDPSLCAIRNAIKYLRSSPSRLEKFKFCVGREKIESKKLPSLDVATRWNSTFLMLDSALKFEKAFARMENEDGLYVKYFGEKNADGKQKEGPPDMFDWEKANKLAKFLRTFHDVTLKFSSSLNVTSNLYFKEICNIEHALKTFTNNDSFVLRDMVKNMKEKFDKYWGNVDKMNKLLIVAIVLDPRYKMEYIVYCASILYDASRVNAMKLDIEKFLYTLYNEYKRFNESGRKKGISESCFKEGLDVIDGVEESDEFNAFNMVDLGYKKMKTSHIDASSNDEIKKYLTEATDDPSNGFDILCWWKVNSSRFEILSEIARDVLAIPVSTVASESAFSTSGRILDSFRSSLTPKSVEALICTQNWLREESRLLRVREDICIEEEELENIETEFINNITTKGVIHLDES